MHNPPFPPAFKILVSGAIFAVCAVSNTIFPPGGHLKEFTFPKLPWGVCPDFSFPNPLPYRNLNDFFSKPTDDKSDTATPTTSSLGGLVFQVVLRLTSLPLSFKLQTE
ncbi:hypothetical protein HOY80DRAFT_949297 [Tuber brumale]|nr:hypothetical protein HOY80DRAFT_949297 [Tuber brumale]